MSETLNARIWRSHIEDFTFPELSTRLVERTADVGICLSGGGNRAAMAGMGQLRALLALGLLERTRYLSCVSGGSWLSTPFTFYRSGSPDDEHFLGPVTPPERITMEDLEAPIPHTCVGWTATRALDHVFLHHLLDCPRDRAWIETVGNLYFAPWGLHDPDHPAPFTYDAASLADIRARNPSLAEADFHLAREPHRRPYLVVNGSIVGDPHLMPLEMIEPLHLGITPLYSGSTYAREALFQARDGRWDAHRVGGGYVESFALGGPAPAERGQDAAVVQAPRRPYQLADASGTSSAFFAGFAERLPVRGLVDFNPRLSLWPLYTDDAEVPFTLGDGGVLENYGMIALLLRGVKRLIVCINTSTPLDLKYAAREKAPTADDLDAYLPPLFGFPVAQVGVNTANNKVFRPHKFIEVVEGLQAAIRAGGPAVTMTGLEVLNNGWWGLEGGFKVQVLWCYLQRSERFEAALGDRHVAAAIDRGNSFHLLPGLHGPFKHFPNYSTAWQNDDLVQMTPAQVKLLADLTCWSMMESEDKLRALFDG